MVCQISCDTAEPAGQFFDFSQVVEFFPCKVQYFLAKAQRHERLGDSPPIKVCAPLSPIDSCDTITGRKFSYRSMKKLSVSIDFKSQNDRSVLLEVALRNEPILFGLWTFEVRLGKKTLLPDGKWSKICEHAERGCDYLEIELPLTGDYRLQRSLLVNHKDKVLLLTDTVLADEEQEPNKSLTYYAEFYVSPKLRAKTFAEVTEIEFRSVGQGGAPVFRALPLALPEWKSTKPAGLVSGTLSEMEGTLVLRQESSGTSLFAPLFFDLDADRLGKRYTWRQLSVGENLRRVREDEAVGYRIQLGQEQFLLYRSLTEPANRTVLGHNLIDDFCFAKFVPETGVDPLIAIEVVE